MKMVPLNKSLSDLLKLSLKSSMNEDPHIIDQMWLKFLQAPLICDRHNHENQE